MTVSLSVGEVLGIPFSAKILTRFSSLNRAVNFFLVVRKYVLVEHTSWLISSASSYDSSLSSASQNSGAGLLLQSQATEREPRIDYGGLDFRLTLDSKSGPPVTITLVASTVQEKAAWCSDVLQASNPSCLSSLDFRDTNDHHTGVD